MEENTNQVQEQTAVEEQGKPLVKEDVKPYCGRTPCKRKGKK